MFSFGKKIVMHNRLTFTPPHSSSMRSLGIHILFNKQDLTWFRDRPVWVANMCLSVSVGYLKQDWKEKKTKFRCYYKFERERERERNGAYGWRKCSNSQALRIETERSGRPLWGLQTCCWVSRKPTLPPPPYLCLCKLWSKCFSLSIFASPLLVLVPVVGDEKSSPKAFPICLSWSEMAFFRHRKCLETDLRAKEM